MWKKFLTLILAMTLWVMCLAPVTAHAAAEPQVLQYKKTAAGEVRYYYDKNGNRVAEEDKTRGTRTEWSYNKAGTMVIEERYKNDSLVSRMEFDAAGNCTAYRLPNRDGKLELFSQYRNTYDHYGRLTSSVETDSVSQTTSARYEYPQVPGTVLFGHYEQDGNTANGPEPIEWQILEADGKEALIVSKYALDSRRYHNQDKKVTWGSCDLREWLNGAFLKAAFSDREKRQIQTRELEKKAGDDYVFLLSLEDVNRYYLDNGARICTATDYAVKQNAYVNPATGGSWWLLRTGGKTKTQVASVNSDGTIDSDGGAVAAKRGTVRPALWVSVTALGLGTDTATSVQRKITYYDEITKKQETSYSSRSIYDAEGRQILQEDAHLGETSYWTYDDHGNLQNELKFYEPGEGYSSVEETMYKNFYNSSFQLIGAEVRQMHRVVSGSEVTEAEIRYTLKYSYDAEGRMVGLDRLNDAGVVERREIWQYDGQGRKNYYELRTQRSHDVTIWEYDAKGNLLKVIRNDTVKEEYTYVPLSKAIRKK